MSDLKIDWAAGMVTNLRWSFHWRFGDRRIEHKLRDNVLVIHALTLHDKEQGTDTLIQVLRPLVERATFGVRPLEWIFLEQVNFRVAQALAARLQFRHEPGMVVDCWRQANGLELPL